MSVLGRLLPFWISGIVSAWFLGGLINPSFYLLSLLFLLILIGLLFVKPKMKSGLPAFSFTAIVLSFFTSFLITAHRYPGSEIPSDVPVILNGKVKKTWEGKNLTRIKLKVYNAQYQGDVYASNESVLLLISKNAPFLPLPGMLIQTETKIGAFQKKESQSDFPERLYYAGEGIRRKGWAGSLRMLDSLSPSLLYKASLIQDVLCQRIDSSSINEESSFILKAMLLGKKSDLPNDIRDVFRQTGISHLLAVSGLHVGLIYLLIVSLFFFARKKWMIGLTETIAVISIWLYAFITGFGPSVQRAAGMISLFVISRASQRKVHPIQILILSFILQTASNPTAIFQFGFQLSYMALGGILLFYKSWTGLVKFRFVPFRKIWNFAGVSLSAQSLTFPFLLLYFREFPIYFIPGNLLMVPIGLAAFYAGAIQLIAASIGIRIPLLSKIINLTIGFMVSIGETISQLPLSVIKIESFSFFHLAVYFIVMLILIMPYRISVYKRLKGIILSFILLSIYHCFRIL